MSAGAPLVSVIVPTHNRPALLQRAVASALAQTWDRIEVVIVDDGSTDATPDAVDGLVSADGRVRAVRNDTPAGGSAARNRGLDEATGTVIAFLDDDDEWLPSKVERQLAHLDQRPHLGALSCHHEIVDPGLAAPVIYRGPIEITADDLLWDNFAGSASFCLWRRSAFTTEPRFDPALPSCQDWDVWLQCAATGPVEAVPEVLCRYEAHTGARITGSAAARVAGRRRIIERHGERMSAPCRAYHEARVALLERDGSMALPVAMIRGGPKVAWMLAAASVAGRRGDRAGDPGRGSRRLHELVRAATRA